MALLAAPFFEREVEAVARELIGAEIRLGAVVLRITETEAYGGPDDSASHARAGRTERNAVMWGPPGRVYVYLCYGIHQMLNLVTGPAGEAGAVLIRACEPLAGLEIVRRRRGGRRGVELLAGPGRVGAALGLDTGWSHHDACRPGGMELHRPTRPAAELLAGPRVGVSFASAADRAAPRRFAEADTIWISRKTSSS